MKSILIGGVVGGLLVGINLVQGYPASLSYNEVTGVVEQQQVDGSWKPFQAPQIGLQSGEVTLQGGSYEW